MIAWWESLAVITKIFYCIAIPSTLLLLIQTIMMLIGVGDDADGFGDSPDDLPDSFGDIDDIGESLESFGLEGLRIFTARGLLAFLVVFGWVGIVMEGGGAPLWATLLVSTVSGFAIMLLLAYLLRLVMRLKSDGNADNKNAIGSSGKVYLTIPAQRSGEGKVQIMLQGSFVERNAVTDSEDPIPTGAEVVVIGLSGQTDLVVRKK